MTNKNIVMENAKIAFRNFSGEEGTFNPAGKRNFCVFLSDELAEVLINDGWNVKWLKPRNEDEAPQAYLQVAVNYDNIPPKIIMVTSKGKTNIEEESVHILDWAEIENVDLVIRPYNWEVSGKTGVKAYLKSMYITIHEDELDLKYQDYENVPDSAKNSIVDDDYVF